MHHSSILPLVTTTVGQNEMHSTKHVG